MGGHTGPPLHINPGKKPRHPASSVENRTNLPGALPRAIIPRPCRPVFAGSPEKSVAQIVLKDARFFCENIKIIRRRQGQGHPSNSGQVETGFNLPGALPRAIVLRPCRPVLVGLIILPGALPRAIILRPCRPVSVGFNHSSRGVAPGYNTASLQACFWRFPGEIRSADCPKRCEMFDERTYIIRRRLPASFVECRTGRSRLQPTRRVAPGYSTSALQACFWRFSSEIYGADCSKRYEIFL